MFLLRSLIFWRLRFINLFWILKIDVKIVKKIKKIEKYFKFKYIN